MLKYISIRKIVFCLSLFMFIAIVSGCTSSHCLHYPDQRTVFFESPKAKDFELFETSAYELELNENRSFSRAVIALNALKEDFADDSNVVQYVEAQVKHMRKYHEAGLDGLKEFTDTLRERDRVFRFIYDGEDVYKTGILVLRDGKIVRRMTE